MIREFLEKVFSERTAEVDPENAAEFYREQRQQDIHDMEQRADRLRQQSREAVEDVETALEELKDRENEKDLQVIDDVADNFYSSRKKMIERLELPEDIEQHVARFEEFSEEFNDVSRKEGEVLKHINKGEGDLPGAIQQLSSHVEKLQKFLDEEYSVVRKHEELEELVEELEEKKSRLEGIETDQGEVEEVEEELDEKKQEIQEFEEGQEWQERQLMQENVEELKDDREEIRSELSRHVSKIDRSLKKLIYQVENGEVEFDADLDKLRKLEDHEFDDLQDVEDAIKEAESIIRDNDIVGERQQRKFEKTASELARLDERKKDIRRIDEGIEELRQKLEENDADEKRQQLARERKQIEKELEKAREDRNEREEEVESLQEDVEELEEEIISVLDSSLGIDVEKAE